MHLALLLFTTLVSGVSGASLFGTVTSAVTAVLSGVLEGRAPPKITLDYGTFRGVADSITKTDNFLGTAAQTSLSMAHSNDCRDSIWCCTSLRPRIPFQHDPRGDSRRDSIWLFLPAARNSRRVGSTRPESRSLPITSRGCIVTICFRPVGGLSKHKRPGSGRYISRCQASRDDVDVSINPIFVPNNKDLTMWQTRRGIQ